LIKLWAGKIWLNSLRVIEALFFVDHEQIIGATPMLSFIAAIAICTLQPLAWMNRLLNMLNQEGTVPYWLVE
jgi:hypothetical protein